LKVKQQALVATRSPAPNLILDRRPRESSMGQRQVSSWSAQWTCVGGSCAPTAPPPTTAWERAADRYRAAAAIVFGGGLFLLGALLVYRASISLPVRWGLVVAGIYFLGGASYCAVNFLRCHEAHCIVTSIGWTALGLVVLAGAVVAAGWLRWAWLAFLVVLITGHVFEGIWRATHGSNALRRT
jgi:hypothetical protein